MKKIQIKICPNGTIEAKTLGIRGKKCTDYISVLEKLLEAKTHSTSYTDEYYMSEVITNETVIKESEKLS